MEWQASAAVYLTTVPASAAALLRMMTVAYVMVATQTKTALAIVSVRL
tara:strand:- start:543 stop:686 length:144 start_codon:yes stop_codon:yes gene_type:complete